MAAPATLRLASTVMVLDPGAEPPRIFMGQRPSRSSFMAEAWVFPGGAVDPTDAGPAGLSPATAHARLGAPEGVSPEAALAIHVAAARELFEEAGILLARHPGGPLVTGDQAESCGVEEAREALLAGTVSFGDLLASLGLTLDVSLLAPWARWTTPEEEPKRFDTFFFVTLLPGGQRASPALGELTQAQWIDARTAVEAHAGGWLWLAPPTLRVLEELAALGPLGTIVDAAHSRSLHAIMPRLRSDRGEVEILFPGHPDHPDPVGPGVWGAKRLILTSERVWKAEG